MKDKDEPAFVEANDNNDDEPPSKGFELLPAAAGGVPLPGGGVAVAIASLRASSVVVFRPNTCTVPLSLETPSHCKFAEKAIL